MFHSTQIEELQQVNMLSPVSQSPNKQKTSLLVPQRTMMRLNSSKASTLKVPSISNSFRSSSRKILSSMMTSVLDIQNSPQTFFHTIQSESDYGDGSYNDTDSVCTDASYRQEEFDINKDGVVSQSKTKSPSPSPEPQEYESTGENMENKEQSAADDIIISLSPRKQQATQGVKSRRSSNSLQREREEELETNLSVEKNKSIDLVVDMDNNNPQTVSRWVTPKALLSRKSIDVGLTSSEHTKGNVKSVRFEENVKDYSVGSNSSPFGPKFDMKLFEMKLQEEIKKEMEVLEKELQRQYNVEFEKKKDELIDVHEESLAYVTAQHEKLGKELEKLRKEYGEKLGGEGKELPQWQWVLSQILAF